MRPKDRRSKTIINSFIDLSPILLLTAILYFVNNYYLGWLLYGFSIIVIAVLVIAFFASGNGIPLGFIIPFLALLYLGHIIIEHSNQDDEIIVNIEFLTPKKDDYTIIDTNVKAPNKVQE